jgi:hypothetical protein
VTGGECASDTMKKIRFTSEDNSYLKYLSICTAENVVPLSKDVFDTTDAKSLNVDLNKEIAFTTPGNVITTGKILWNRIPEELRGRIKETVKQKVDEIIKLGNKTKTGDSGGKDGNGNGGGSNNGNANQVKNGGSKYLTFGDFNTISTSLSTPVSTYNYADNLGENSYLIPLWIQNARFEFPKETDSAVLADWFRKVVVPEFQAAASKSVSFRLDSENIFTVENITKYLNDISYALQVFYFYSSIIIFQDGRNRNVGMRVLNESIDPNDLEKLYTLKRRLEQLPIPPRLVEFCRWLMSTYAMGPLPYTPLIKLMPFPFDVVESQTFNTFGVGGAVLDNALNGVNSHGQVSNLLGVIAPNWVNEELYSPMSEAVYDEQFRTLFVNCPSIESNSNGTSVKNFPATTETQEPYTYASYSANLDGAIVACASVWNDDELKPGLINLYPSASGGGVSFNTRLHFNSDSETFSPNWLTGGSEFFSPYTYQLNANGNVAIFDLPPGSFGIKGVSIDSIRESSKEFVEYLLSIETLSKGLPKGYNSKMKRGGK